MSGSRSHVESPELIVAVATLADLASWRRGEDLDPEPDPTPPPAARMPLPRTDVLNDALLRFTEHIGRGRPTRRSDYAPAA